MSEGELKQIFFNKIHSDEFRRCLALNYRRTEIGGVKAADLVYFG